MFVSYRLMFAFVATTFLLSSLYIYYDTIHEHVDYISYKITDAASRKSDSVLFSLVRNEELSGILQSIDHLQTRFNNNFHYDWVFANDVPFTDDFKTTIRERFTSGNAIFAEIPKEYWSYPDHIDQEKAAKTRKEANYIYGGSESYRFMCRFNSGYFYKLKELSPYRYYWRVEPDVKFLCNFVEDPFKVMKENGYVYGWTMTMYEFGATIPTLWESVKKFVKEKNMNIGEGSNNFIKFLSDDQGNTYNNCHFWSNFEVADLNFFRSQEYEEFFQHLDKDGGFFYERWGDAPVHSIAVALMLEPEKIHHFANTGYYHAPNQGCPRGAEIRNALGCECKPRQDWTFNRYSCTPRYYQAKNLDIPKITH